MKIATTQAVSIDPEKLLQALCSFAGVVEKAQTMDDVNRAAHQLRQNVKQAKVQP